MDPNFEELSNDVDLIARMKQFQETRNRIEETIQLAADPKLYETLSNADKIKYNCLMSFSLNSLFWMYLRAEGVDPTKHQIKAENDRLKQTMSRAQEIRDRKTKMPRIDKNIAQRFVRSGLWTPRNNENDEGHEEETWDMQTSTNNPPSQQ